MSIGIRKTFNLDMVPGGAPPVIHVSAGDVGRPFRANLLYSGETYGLDAVTSVKIRGTKPDKTVFEYDLTFDTEDSHVDFIIEEQMAIIAGPVLCEIRLFSGEDTIGSANFILDVETAVFNASALSESEVIGLSDLVESATAEWFENDAPTSETFTNAVGTAVADYVEDNGVGFTLKVDYKTRPGYIGSNGSHTEPNGTSLEEYTNKIPCFPGDTVTYSFVWESTAAKWGTIAFYDDNGRFISRSSALFSGNDTNYSGSVTIPANAYYYSFTWRTYGNCTAEFSYTGSVYAIRNRIDKGLVYESSCGEWDTGNMNPDKYTNNEVVIANGFRPITDFIPVKHGKILVKKDSAYTSELYCHVAQYDEGKNRLENINFSILNPSKLFELSPDAAYVRLIFDGHGQPNSSDSPTPAAIIPYVSWYTNYWYEALTPIICGSQTYPAVDRDNKTFTIPYDCIFFKNGKEVRPSSLMSVSTATVLNIPTTTSAWRLYFDISANEYTWKAWNETLTNPDDLILVAVFRVNFTTGYYSVAITCPYYIDGKLYGIDATATVDLDAIAWAFGENVKGINHRGYNTAPENTLPAYKLSKKNGFKYVECDVSMTSDRVPVLLHDDTINRTARNADGTEVSSTISIGSITYEQALQYDFGIYKGSQYAGTKIPTFEQFIKLCRNLGLHPYIELKSGGGYTQAEVENLVDIVELNGMKGKVTWISFSSSLLEYVKNYDAAARLGFIVGAATSANVTTANGLKTANNEVFLDVSGISSSIIGECVSANIPVEIWTVNSTATIEGLDPYITGVTSDNLIAAKVLYEANI